MTSNHENLVAGEFFVLKPQGQKKKNPLLLFCQLCTLMRFQINLIRIRFWILQEQFAKPMWILCNHKIFQ